MRVAETPVGLGGQPLSAADATVDRYHSHVRGCVICRTAVARLVAARVVAGALTAGAAGMTLAGVATAAVSPAMTVVAAVVAVVGGVGTAAVTVTMRRFGATDTAKRLAHKV